jgi:hypothetical protein
MIAVLCTVAELVGLGLLIQAIYSSQRRWLSFGYAILAFVVTLALGFLLVPLLFALVFREASLMTTNQILDTVGAGVDLASPFAALYGASIPPRRGAPA